MENTIGTLIQTEGTQGLDLERPDGTVLHFASQPAFTTWAEASLPFDVTQTVTVLFADGYMYDAHLLDVLVGIEGRNLRRYIVTH